MVSAWLIREEGIFANIKKEPLQEFSEHLAVNLWVNKENRKAEHIRFEEIRELAQKWDIPLDDWQLTGRSLLNRDAMGNYKFAHRSIMEFLFVKRFINGDSDCRHIPWSDQMQMFLWKMIQKYETEGKSPPFDLDGADLSLMPLVLRDAPLLELSEESVKKMLAKYNFFDANRNPAGKGIRHNYLELGDRKIVEDRKTGLMWQQSGSEEYILFEKAQIYIDRLNRKEFGGFNDWRLPTLEEVMSLIEPEKKDGELYIDSRFGKRQPWIWTADLYSGTRAWGVGFHDDGCDPGVVGYGYVRAVRSGQSSVDH